MGQVVADGATGQGELAGDLLVGQAPGRQAQHVDLAFGKVVRSGRPGSRQARRLDDRGHGFGVQGAGSRRAGQFGRRGGQRAGGTPGPGLGQLAQRIGRGEQASLEGQVSRAHAPVVTGAVEPLVMTGRQRGECGQRRAALQHPRGPVGMQADLLPGGRAERARLIPDRTGDARPADVMQ
jgi:hypothetical protein